MKIERICPVAAVILIVLQVALVLVTWIINAAAPELPIRSLLSQEGIRWFFGTFVSNLASWPLVWLLLLSMAWSTFCGSGLLHALRVLMSSGHLGFRQSFGLKLALCETIVFVIIGILLTCIPHAVLLSVTGHLFPSSFSSSIVPMSSLSVILVSLTYGAASGSVADIRAAYSVVVVGQKSLVWLLPIYVLATELYHSVLFVFGHVPFYTV